MPNRSVQGRDGTVQGGGCMTLARWLRLENLVGFNGNNKYFNRDSLKEVLPSSILLLRDAKCNFGYRHAIFEIT